MEFRTLESPTSRRPGSHLRVIDGDEVGSDRRPHEYSEDNILKYADIRLM